jgi:hypothetical protein
MDLISNPWFIVFTALNILITIIIGIRFIRVHKKKNKYSFIDLLTKQGISPNIRCKKSQYPDNDSNNKDTPKK